MENNFMNDFADLEAIIKNNVNKLDSITDKSNENTFSALPNGYYLCTLESFELKRTKGTAELPNGKPMFSARFKCIKNGYSDKKNAAGELVENEHTANRLIFKNWVLKTQLEDPDGKAWNSFVSDCLKFNIQIPNDNGELMDSSAIKNTFFTDLALTRQFIEVLVGYNIYVNVNNTQDKTDPSKTNSFNSLITWDRARDLGLPNE